MTEKVSFEEESYHWLRPYTDEKADLLIKSVGSKPYGYFTTHKERLMATNGCPTTAIMGDTSYCR